MNELLFLLHLLLVFGFALGALKLGKEALTAWIALQAVLANLFVLKQMLFFGFNITCSDVFAIGSLFGVNLLREYHGKESAQRALAVSFFCMVFFVVMAKIHLLYLPSREDRTHPAYMALLSLSPRLLGASIIAFAVVQQVDLRLFGYLKRRFSQLPLFWRNGFSLSLSQGLDTLLFGLLGLWGVVASLGELLCVSFLVKLCIVVVLSPLIAFSKRVVPS